MEVEGCASQALQSPGQGKAETGRRNPKGPVMPRFSLRCRDASALIEVSKDNQLLEHSW